MNTAGLAPDGRSDHHAGPELEVAADAPHAVTPSTIRSETLLRGQPSVAIHHHGAIYRLQTTRQGKLILTK